MTEPAQQTDESQALIDAIAEVLTQGMGLSAATSKITELATAVTNRLRIIREPGPHDVIAVFVDMRIPRPELWLKTFLNSVRLTFPGARPCVLPVEMDLQRIPADKLQGFRDKIAEMLNMIELHLAAAQAAPEASPAAESGD